MDGSHYGRFFRETVASILTKHDCIGRKKGEERFTINLSFPQLGCVTPKIDRTTRHVAGHHGKKGKRNVITIIIIIDVAVMP